MDQQPSAAPPACYRHSDRPTRLSCSECGRFICPECSVDAAVGQKCPECAAPSERYRVIPARQITRANRTLTPVVTVLMVINGLLFLAGLASDSLRLELVERFSHQTHLVDQGEWWRLFTAMFLHSHSMVMHIFFNLYALWIFGPVLEHRFGSLSFAALYVASGLGGGALFQAFNEFAGAVGASSAIFGLFGALLTASYRQRHTPAGRAVFTQLMILLAINAALPLFVRFIAWEGHLGGLLVGIAVALAWERIPRGPKASWQRAVVAAAIGAIALATVLVL